MISKSFCNIDSLKDIHFIKFRGYNITKYLFYKWEMNLIILLKKHKIREEVKNQNKIGVAKYSYLNISLIRSKKFLSFLSGFGIKLGEC